MKLHANAVVAENGQSQAKVAVLVAGEARKQIVWSRLLVASAAPGVATDHNGYLAARHLMPKQHALTAE